MEAIYLKTAIIVYDYESIKIYNYDLVKNRKYCLSDWFTEKSQQQLQKLSVAKICLKKWPKIMWL